MNMTREQLEKDFDEKFCIPESFERLKDDVYSDEIKTYVFNELIPEVLREIKPKQQLWFSIYNSWYNACLEEIRKKAKDKFNIDL